METQILSEEDYRRALAKIDELIAHNPTPGSEAYKELDLLGNSVFQYEEIHYPIK